MNIDAIRNGIVIDHIRAGKAMEIYKLLNLEALDCSVAIIKNVNADGLSRCILKSREFRQNAA